MGRPPSKAVVLRDGFYIQVRNKGASSGIKIRSTDSKSMMDAAAEYMKSKEKEVLVLGELKKGVWLNEQAAADKKKQETKELKKTLKLEKTNELKKSNELKKAAELEKPKKLPKTKEKPKVKAKTKVKSKSK